MASRTLYITLISGEDLTCPYTFKPVKKNAMAMIRLPGSTNPSGQVFSTTLDKNNGPYPLWNETFRVEMPVNVHWFEVEIRRGMDTVIGVAPVPVADFVNNLVPVGYLNCLSYRLRGRHGGFVTGIVNISVRVASDQCFSKDKISSGQPVVQDFGGMGKVKRHEDECSASSSQYGAYGGLDKGDVVMGVPVSCGMNKM